MHSSSSFKDKSESLQEPSIDSIIHSMDQRHAQNWQGALVGTIPIPRSGQVDKNYKSHKAYIEKSKTVSESTNPVRFKENMKWDDWFPIFINFPKAIPGRNGVPLSQIFREYYDVMLHNPNSDFLDNYILQAPLYGDAFKMDTSEVHTIFCQLHVRQRDCRGQDAPACITH